MRAELIRTLSFSPENAPAVAVFGGKATHCRIYGRAVGFVSFISQTMAFTVPDIEGTTWISGTHELDSREVQVLLAAYILYRSGETR